MKEIFIKDHKGQKLIIDNSKPIEFELRNGAYYKNVTREQVVKMTEFTEDRVWYFWEGSRLPSKQHVKSIEHFFRSYKPLIY